MDNNSNKPNNAGGQRKYYKKRNHHNKDRKPTRQERIAEAEEIDEVISALTDATPKSDKTNEHNLSGKINNKPKKNNNKKNDSAESKTDLSGDEKYKFSFEDDSEKISESCMLDAIDSIDDLDEKDSVSDLLLLDGTDDVDIFAEENEKDGKNGEEEEKYEVIGVRFPPASKTYYFDPAGFNLKNGSGVIVETVRGDKYGICNMANSFVSAKNVFLPLKKVLRIATPDDKIVNEENIELAQDAFRKCNRKIAEHGLDMKLIEAAYTHDRSKLIFFFTAPTRVDFRELVKDLAFMFKTRIDLRQIGIRDEAKMIGGYGICGRTLCCCSFLPNFNQVSIKMAKEQNLSLNTSKISGVCGRLMCCLKFEHKTYLDEAKLMPPIGSIVKTTDGNGEVVEVNPIGGTVKVKLKDAQDTMPKFYPQKDISVLNRNDRPSEWQSGEEDSSN